MWVGSRRSRFNFPCTTKDRRHRSRYWRKKPLLCICKLVWYPKFRSWNSLAVLVGQTMDLLAMAYAFYIFIDCDVMMFIWCNFLLPFLYCRFWSLVFKTEAGKPVLVEVSYFGWKSVMFQFCQRLLYWLVDICVEFSSSRNRDFQTDFKPFTTKFIDGIKYVYIYILKSVLVEQMSTRIKICS